jgi:uncharacterized membrane protein
MTAKNIVGLAILDFKKYIVVIPIIVLLTTIFFYRMNNLTFKLDVGIVTFLISCLIGYILVIIYNIISNYISLKLKK